MGTPSVPRHEFLRRAGICERKVQRLFGSYNGLVEAAGLKPRTFPIAESRSERGLSPLSRVLSSVPLLDLDLVIRSLPRKPRYINAAPRTICELSRIVCEECGGDATQLWTGKTATQVQQTLLRVFGVGEGLANIAVLLVQKAYDFQFSDFDPRTIDKKPDVHTTRVLHRLGIIPIQAPMDALTGARRLNPGSPGDLDAPLWYIGKRWCHSLGSECASCPLVFVCPQIGVHA